MKSLGGKCITWDILRLGFQHWVHNQIITNDHKLKTVHQHLFLENLYIQLKFPHAHLGTWFPGSLWGTEAGVSQLNLVSRVTVGVGVHSWIWFPGSLWGWEFTVEPGFQGHSRRFHSWTWLTTEPGIQGPFSWIRRALNKGRHSPEKGEPWTRAGSGT